MAELPHVFILGNSVLMAGLALLLGQRSDLHVHKLNHVADIRSAWTAAQAATSLLIYDAAMIAPTQVMTALPDGANIALIGVDIGGGKATTIVGSSHPLHTIQDLAQLIEQVHTIGDIQLDAAD